MIEFFTIGPGVSFTIYAILQMLAVFKLKSGWRLCALIPIPIAVWIVVSTVDAFQAESNLWPIGMIFFGLVASGYLALLFAGPYLFKKFGKKKS